MRNGESRSQAGFLGRTLAVILGAALVLSPSSRLAVSAYSPVLADGALDIATDPAGAVVYIDGSFAGHTPLTVDRLPVGDHQIRITRNGYLENRRTISVESDKPNTLDVRLTRDATGSAAAVRAPGDSILSNPILWAAVGGGAVAVFLATRGGNSGPSVSGVSASPSTALASAMPVSFSAQGANDPDGDTMTFMWDFGDGMTASGMTTSHVFANEGNYTVRLTVSDGSASASAMTNVQVRSMTGTWDGDFFGAVFNLTQNGSTITGNYTDVDGPGTVNGIVQSAMPYVNLVIDQPQFPLFTFVGDPDGNVNAVTGTILGGPGVIRRR